MLLDARTNEKFGYFASSLSSGSKKIIVCQCDYCGSEYDVQNKNRNNSYKKFPKDCCIKCKYKKREDVSMATHGVKNSAQRPEVRKKISETGWMGSEEFREKRSATMIERYGSDNIFDSEELKAKYVATMLEKYGVEHPSMNNEIMSRIVANSRKTNIASGLWTEINGKTMPEHASDIGLSRSFFGKLVKERGFENAIAHEKFISSLESKVMFFLNDLDIKYERDITIDRLKPDLVIGDIIIECDGLYWHSDEFVDKNYHMDKHRRYIESGYTSLFFRSDEILNKFDIVKSIILNKVGKSIKYQARKLRFKIIDNTEAHKFMDDNHLMGSAKTASVSYGLYDKDELISCMQFKRKKGPEYDLSRFCNKLNVSVVGAYSKFLHEFIERTDFTQLSNFIDMRYGSGAYLNKFGFSFIHSSPSFKWTDGSVSYHRLKFPGNSGYELGLHKIWDCGQAKYILEK